MPIYLRSLITLRPTEAPPPVGGGQSASRDPRFSTTTVVTPVPEGLKAPMRLRLPKSAYVTHEPEADEFVEDHRSETLSHIAFLLIIKRALRLYESMDR